MSASSPESSAFALVSPAAFFAQSPFGKTEGGGRTSARSDSTRPTVPLDAKKKSDSWIEKQKTPSMSGRGVPRGAFGVRARRGIREAQPDVCASASCRTRTECSQAVVRLNVIRGRSLLPHALVRRYPRLPEAVLESLRPRQTRGFRQL